MIRETAIGRIVVNAIASAQKSKAVHRRVRIGDGVSQPVFEPTQRTGARATQQNSSLPCLSNEDIQTPMAPNRKHAPCVSSAYLEDVEIRYELRQMSGRPIKEPQHFRFDAEIGVCGNNVTYVFGAVAACGRDVADVGSLLAR